MTLTDHLPALQVVVPMLIAPLVVLMRIRGLPWAVATVTSLMAFAIAVGLTDVVFDRYSATYEMGSWRAPYGIELHVTRFSALLLLIVTGASTLALVAGKQSIDNDIEQERLIRVWQRREGVLVAKVELLGLQRDRLARRFHFEAQVESLVGLQGDYEDVRVHRRRP